MHVWDTTDLGSAAYVYVKGLRVIGVFRNENRFTFRFEDPDQVGRALQIEYMNSEARKFDEALRGLKKLCYGR